MYKIINISEYEWNVVKYMMNYYEDVFIFSTDDILTISGIIDMDNSTMEEQLAMIQYAEKMLNNLVSNNIIQYVRTYHIEVDNEFKLVSEREHSIVQKEIDIALKQINDNATEQYVHDNMLHFQFNQIFETNIKKKYNWTRCCIVYHAVLLLQTK